MCNIVQYSKSREVGFWGSGFERNPPALLQLFSTSYPGWGLEPDCPPPTHVGGVGNCWENMNVRHSHVSIKSHVSRGTDDY